MLKNIYIFLFVYIIVNTIYSETVSAYIYTNSIEMGKGYSKSTSSVETLPSENVQDEADSKYFGQMPETSEDYNYMPYSPYTRVIPYYGGGYSITRPYYYSIRPGIGSYNYTGHSYNYGTMRPPLIINRPPAMPPVKPPGSPPPGFNPGKPPHFGGGHGPHGGIQPR